MVKKKTRKNQTALSVTETRNRTVYRHQCGTIRDNALQALLHDPLFRQRVEKKLKGKGSYQRKPKFVKSIFEKPDDKMSRVRDFIIGFFLINKHDMLN
ncbi:ribosome alternative rescue factor ArfA [Actinobacillus succinogenes]|uniref:Alternative ribosome-rescue factor A n=1 Tax=Actinobacillus succinogenes (strain ATCC 55618 / DSM 22257 / CCUG 43843 / 130Z) TaxID=339671 RepID=A6VQZ2_ACTSZ|nr:ribosome alternative rescue factor ArfA [Actinobacillus succinogenes]ABR75389.1 protein of unknown function DUF331 [Actinobacillus succinogenes 130Z]PHI40223.1 ribosome alternative rescue factor ArfA [Actinobacillus succinogenes]